MVLPRKNFIEILSDKKFFARFLFTKETIKVIIVDLKLYFNVGTRYVFFQFHKNCHECPLNFLWIPINVSGALVQISDFSYRIRRLARPQLSPDVGSINPHNST